jgi:hypothetical protein
MKNRANGGQNGTYLKEKIEEENEDLLSGLHGHIKELRHIGIQMQE